MTNKDKKVLFFDIDGTLAMPGQNVDNETLNAIKKARENGHYAFLNTGRSSNDIPEPIKDVGFDGGVYSSGGKIIIGDKLYKEEFLDPGLLKRTLNLLLKYGFSFNLEGKHYNYTNQSLEDIKKIVNREGLSSELQKALLRDEEVGMSRPRDFSKYNGEPVYKMNIQIFRDQEENFEKLKKQLGSEILVTTFDNLFPNNFVRAADISSNKYDKGTAIKEVCEILDIPYENSIAFGDSSNDYKMIKQAAVGVAMGNSSKDILEVADIITDNCGQGGIKRTLEELNVI